ncbi:MAG: hypothetical protein U5R46_05270 [Gammaproteobacteria bacterium]|nr:hypothetical protein [Gammaproteobacteria bacterium]
MIRPIRFFVFCGALAVGVLCGAELFNRFDDQTWVLPVDPLREARALAVQQRWAEARLLADFVQDNPRLGDERAAAELSRQAEARLDSYWGQVRSFGRGAATGEPTDGASMLGSLSLDLFVIGDIRDLAVQGWKEMRYGEGDTVILALSAIGLTTTLAPQFDWAPALLKALKRTGALTTGFLRSLKNASRTALKTGRFDGIGSMVNDVGRTARNLGPGPLRGAMRSVDSADDLARLARASEIQPKGTYAIARLFGNGGVKRISRDGRNVGTLVAAMKTGSRLGKIAKKSVGTLPNSWLAILLALSALIAGASLWPRHRRRKQRGVRGHERSEPSLNVYLPSTPRHADR